MLASSLHRRRLVCCTLAAVPWVIGFYEAMMRPLCSALRSLIKTGWVIFFYPSTYFSELLTIFPGPDISRCQFPDISGYQICSFSENNLTKSLDMTCNFWHFSIQWLLLWPEAGDFKPLHQDRIVAARCKYFLRLSTSWIFNEMRRCDAARNWLCKFLHPIGILWISSVGKFYSLLM